MARLPRLVLPSQPLHIMHRGNNRQNIFEKEGDMARILHDIGESVDKVNCQLHAYVIMTNHLHLLLYPWSSYHHNALGEEDQLKTEHPIYLALAATKVETATGYKFIMDKTTLGKENQQITDATLRG